MSKGQEGQERWKRREEKHFNIYLSYTLSKRALQQEQSLRLTLGLGVGVDAG